ncbi:MAG TPA: hypothetical protein VM818_21160 [Vicinamibacterales bacterium]|nr:hypothetical protein [Vicinamibacterales bacterium]
MTNLDQPVTCRELREELKAFATKEDLKAFATKEDLKAFATKEDLKAFATKEDLKAFATRDDLLAMRDELRTHFNVVAESFKSDLANLYDWTRTNVDGLSVRVGAIETGHGGRLLSLETRVTSLELKQPQKKASRRRSGK